MVIRQRHPPAPAAAAAGADVAAAPASEAAAGASAAEPDEAKVSEVHTDSNRKQKTSCKREKRDRD